jgi:hypothetical protein
VAGKELVASEQLAEGSLSAKGNRKTKKVCKSVCREEYSKEIERHLKLQEEQRLEEAKRVREHREQLRKETDETTRRNHSTLERNHKVPGHRCKRIINFERSNKSALGVKDVLNWSRTEDHPEAVPSDPLTPRLDRMLKLQHQKGIDRGLSVQYKS